MAHPKTQFPHRKSTQYGSVRKERTNRNKVLARQVARAEAVLAKYAGRLRRRKGVVGLDVGLKFKNLKLVRPLRYVIRVHVQSKLDGTLLPDRLRLPSTLDGVGVDVLERKYLPAQATVGPRTPPEWTHFRPILTGGCAISCDGGRTLGTLGMQVFFGKTPHFLTNKHVAGAKGKPVSQPPLLGPGVPTDHRRVIGVVSSKQALIPHAAMSETFSKR